MMFCGVNERVIIKCVDCKYKKKAKFKENSHRCKKMDKEIQSSDCFCDQGKRK